MLETGLQGKVAVVSGAARGQGRSHCVHLAAQGVDIVAIDICGQVPTVPYDMATPTDLEETVAAVESLGRRIVAVEADVRDYEAIANAVNEGVDRFGRLDIVVANAGIGSFGAAVDLSLDQWNTMIDVNLTGVWHTVKATVPHIQQGGRGGSVILTSSIWGVMGTPNLAHYAAAKHGVVGLMQVLANELGPEMIRVNTVNPTAVDTPIVHNPATYRLFIPDSPEPTREEVAVVATRLNLLPIPWVDASDISNAVVFLASDLARYVTGVVLPIDAGIMTKTT